LWSKLHAAESTQIVMQRPCTHVKRHGRSEAPVGLASVMDLHIGRQVGLVARRQRSVECSLGRSRSAAASFTCDLCGRVDVSRGQAGGHLRCDVHSTAQHVRFLFIATSLLWTSCIA
jgi:hypothetical protein